MTALPTASATTPTGPAPGTDHATQRRTARQLRTARRAGRHRAGQPGLRGRAVVTADAGTVVRPAPGRRGRHRAATRQPLRHALRSIRSYAVARGARAAAAVGALRSRSLDGLHRPDHQVRYAAEITATLISITAAATVALHTAHTLPPLH